MATATRTTDRQAPTALLALVQHINDHNLGAPISIQAPSAAAPYFSVAIPSATLDAWTDSGLAVHHTLVEPHTSGRIAGARWERVQLDGHLQPYGIAVQLVTMRPLPRSEETQLRLAEVPC